MSGCHGNCDQNDRMSVCHDNYVLHHCWSGYIGLCYKLGNTSLNLLLAKRLNFNSWLTCIIQVFVSVAKGLNFNWLTFCI